MQETGILILHLSCCEERTPFIHRLRNFHIVDDDVAERVRALGSPACEMLTDFSKMGDFLWCSIAWSLV